MSVLCWYVYAGIVTLESFWAAMGVKVPAEHTWGNIETLIYIFQAKERLKDKEK